MMFYRYFSIFVKLYVSKIEHDICRRFSTLFPVSPDQLVPEGHMARSLVKTDFTAKPPSHFQTVTLKQSVCVKSEDGLWFKA
jgi:hypothetical protein